MLQMEQQNRQRVKLVHPNGTEFVVFLTEYEINRAESGINQIPKIQIYLAKLVISTKYIPLILLMFFRTYIYARNYGKILLFA